MLPSAVSISPCLVHQFSQSYSPKGQTIQKNWAFDKGGCLRADLPGSIGRDRIPARRGEMMLLCPLFLPLPLLTASFLLPVFYGEVPVCY